MERPFVNNVYRRSLALALPRPFPFPGVQLNSLPTYRRALLSERLEQASIHTAMSNGFQTNISRKRRMRLQLYLSTTPKTTNVQS